jgi:hypothetical protein
MHAERIDSDRSLVSQKVEDRVADRQIRPNGARSNDARKKGAD